MSGHDAERLERFWEAIYGKPFDIAHLQPDEMGISLLTPLQLAMHYGEYPHLIEHLDPDLQAVVDPFKFT